MPAQLIARARRGVVVVLAVLLLTPVLAADVSAETGPKQDPKTGKIDVPQLAKGEYDAPPTPKPAPELPKPQRPKASKSKVTLAGKGDKKQAGSSPVSVKAKGDKDSGRELQVEILEETLADQVGADGFLFRVSDLTKAPHDRHLAEESSRLKTSPFEDRQKVDPKGTDPVSVSVDYSLVATAFGGDYAARLQLRLVPPCAFEVPVPRGCDAGGVLLDTTHDFSTSTLTADLDPDGIGTVAVAEGESAAEDPTATTSTTASAGTTTTTVTADSTTTPSSADTGAEVGVSMSASATTADPVEAAPSGELQAVEPAGFDAMAGGSVLMLTSGVSGQKGSFAATPLSQSSSWQVGPGSGEFSWNYPIPVQPGPAGDGPDLNLGYSSARIDAMTGGENNQPAQEGLGWGFTEAYVERRYVSCWGEGAGEDDLCWRKDNAVLHLNGVSTELIKISATEWKAKDDPNWKITRGTGAVNGDNDGEYWRVRTPDGTVYDFGTGTFPASEGGLVTDSVLTVPVWGDDLGDPCDIPSSPFNLGFCSQAWRWNLDRVVDTKSNVTAYAYTRETNSYQIHFYNSDAAYHRSSRLTRIESGRRVGQVITAASRVVLDSQYRCTYLIDTCPNPTSAAFAPSYPDVPIDLLCSSGCLKRSPTFFTSKRYSAVHSQTFHDGSYQDVDIVTLVHGFYGSFEDADGDGYQDTMLTLLYLDHTGDGPSGLMTMPTIAFGSTLKINRADANPPTTLELRTQRLDTIYTETGAKISINYFQPRPCFGAIPTNWDTNTKDCFQRTYTPPGGIPETAVWAKYLVATVITEDTVGGSPQMMTRYTYHGDPAWHYDDDPLKNVGEPQGWSSWRGYETTTVTEGQDSTAVHTRTQYHRFRGMHGDKLANGGTKTVNVTTTDNVVYADNDWRFGRMLEEVRLANDGATIVRAKRYAYTGVPKGTSIIDGRVAQWAGLVGTRDRYQESGSTYRSKVTSITYNPANQLVENQVDEGWDTTTADDRCTRTLYATPNTSFWLLAFPQDQTLRTGTTCTSGTIVRQSQWHYDGLALGAAPAPGNPGNVTKQRLGTALNVWSDTNMTYDALGRVTSVTDPNGNLTQTAYAPAPSTGSNPHPISMTTTVLKSPLPVDAADLVTTVNLDPERIGSPRSVIDPNGKTTTITYDPLGRTDKVWKPTESLAQTPSLWFWYELLEGSNGYGLSSPAKTAVVTLQKELGATDELLYVYTNYDGMARPRQTATFTANTPAGGITYTQTTYDDRGYVRSQLLPQWAYQWPNQLAPYPTAPDETLYDYDALGRTVNEEFHANGVYKWNTTMNHGYTATTVTPPVGGQKRTTLDADGRVVKVEEQDGASWPSASYTYNVSGDLTGITDPAGNQITYAYDRAGRRTTMFDPDAGAWTYAYDPAGNQTTVHDADTSTGDLVTIYDALNRPTQLRGGSATGTLLSEWRYDATGEKGMLDKTLRYDTMGTFTVDVTGYDNRQRPTGRAWTVPTGAGTLAGTYPITYGYDAADHQTTAGYPAMGGLAAETVTTTYADYTGVATTLVGSQQYVSATTFDHRSRVDTRTLGPAGPTAVTRDYNYNSNQQLAQWKATTGTGTVIQDDIIEMNAVGNITQRVDGRTGLYQSECFGYDQRNRLTTAYTTTSPTCGTPNGSGQTPYNHTYTYAVDGKFATRNEGAGLKTYTYPTQGVGSVRPHAVTAIGSATYAYGPNGNLSSRPGATAQQTLSWDIEHRLKSVVEGPSTTSFVYDADGTRLIRQQPGSTTLYIEGHELKTTGGSPTGKRYYTLDGVAVAVRDATPATLNWLLGDSLGSTSMTVNASTGAIAQQRFLPYGAPRSSSGTQPTERGWIGQTKDTSTGLQYLNARYYDPTIGRFTAVDPLADLRQPSSLDGFGYAGGSPVSASDATGLLCEGDNPCGRGSSTNNGNCIATCKGAGGSSSGVSAGPGASPGSPPPKHAQAVANGNHVYDAFEDAIFYWATWFQISPTLLGTTLEHEGYGIWQGYSMPLGGEFVRLAEYKDALKSAGKPAGSVGIGGMEPGTAAAVAAHFNFAPHSDNELRQRLTFNDDDAVMFAAGKLAMDQQRHDLTDREAFQAYAYSDARIEEMAATSFESMSESRSRGRRWDELSTEVGSHLSKPG